MKDNRLKEQVVRTIREALIERNDTQDRASAFYMHSRQDGDNNNSHAESPFINGDEKDLSVVFAKSFPKNYGGLFYCYSEDDLRNKVLEIQQLHNGATIGCASENLTGFLKHLNVENCETCDLGHTHQLGATLCEALIAWQGSIVISSNLGLGTTIPSLPETTIVIAFTSQVVADWEEANERIKQLYPNYPDQIMVTHPASYAYRKGQQKLYLILIEDEQ